MERTLQLVSDRSTEPREEPDTQFFSQRRAHPPQRRGAAGALRRLRAGRRLRGFVTALRDDEEGAVTAEYAIVIMAAVAFAGLLVAILRSPEIRAMLVKLVENALGTGS